MKKIYKILSLLIFFTLVGLNLYFYIRGFVLSNEMNVFEKKAQQLKIENRELAKKVSAFDSMQYASSMAAEMNFTAKILPIYFENLKYALNR